MATENPFLSFKVECPICRTINEYEMIRVGAYSEDGRDTDFCPLNIKWRNARYQAYNPLVFFTATCGNCYFTREFTNKFKDWKSDTNFRTYRLRQIKEKHLEQLSTADSVVKLMGEAIDIHRFPNESAILKLHLAIYDELLADHPSHLDLGRFYLRIAWLYRDLQRGENPQMLHLRGLMYDLDNKFGMLVQALEQVSSEKEAFAQQVQSHFASEQITSELKSRMLTFQDRYDSQLAEFASHLDTARGSLDTLNGIIAEYKEATLGSTDEARGPSFRNHSSFEAFMADLQKRWPLTAVNERGALERAVEYYKQAFADGRDIAAGAQQIQASYLIAELSRRIGDVDQARQYFTSTIKFGQDFIYKNRNDQSRTVLARKILELAIEQGRANLAEAKTG